MTLGVQVNDLRLRFGDVTALDGLSFQLAGGKIYGLLGRNGSGKSSLPSVIAAFRQATSGQVLVGGQPPFENAAVMRQMCLIRESGDVYEGERISTVLRVAGELRPGFDSGYAARLIERFGLTPRQRVQTLSRGQKSALGCVLGLAGRAPLTMFDESYLGMDAPSRYAFYDALLADVLEHPRMVIVSTHLIEEVSTLFEDVLILDDGRLLLHEEADTLRAAGAAVTGDAAVVDAFTLGLEVLSEKTLGRTKSAMVYGPLDEKRRAQAREVGLDLDPLALQDLFVHLTSGGSR